MHLFDAIYLKGRQAGRIVSVAATIAVGASGDGRREVLGMAIVASEAETFRTGAVELIDRQIIVARRDRTALPVRIAQIIGHDRKISSNRNAGPVAR